MIHSLGDYKEGNNNRNIKKVSGNNRAGVHKKTNPKSLGKYVVPKNNNIHNLYNINNINNNNNQSDKNKFHAFAGKGRAVSHVNTNGLKVNKFVVNKPDKNKPSCKIDIRLFNGEVVTATFNLNQTVRDIKNFVEKKSGSHNFTLLEGFPPKPLTDLKKTIEQLSLKGCMITQKIK